MNREAFEFAENHFDELTPEEFYRVLFGDGHLSESGTAEEYAYHATAMVLDDEHKARFVPVWDNLESLLPLAKGKETVYMPPASYIGRRRTNRNARYLYALAFDLDYLVPEVGLPSLMSQIEKAEVLPRPTLLACSGNGVHLYYVFDAPVPCYSMNQDKLRAYKHYLTKRLWNKYVTEHWRDNQIEYESPFQPMRIVGSLTKDGHIVRGFQVGEKVSLAYMNDFVPEESRMDFMREKRKSQMTLASAKILYPDWYQERIVEGKPRRARKAWYCNRAVYDSYYKRIQTEVVVSHRYYAIMCLAIFAIKCGISREELERDAYGMVKKFDALTISEDNHFTREDVRKALRAYSLAYIHFPKREIEKLTAIIFPSAKRRKGAERIGQKKHLEIARAIRDAKQKQKGTTWNGRKSKSPLVLLWRSEYPEGKPKECADALGIGLSTVYRHWQEEMEKPKSKIEELRELQLMQEALSEQIEELEMEHESLMNENDELNELNSMHDAFDSYIQKHADEIQADASLRERVLAIYEKLQKLTDKALKGGETSVT